MLVYYKRGDAQPDATKYWNEIGKSFYEDNKSLIKPNDEVKKLAASLIAEAKTDDEKLQRLFDYCRTNIKNTNNDASGLTAEEREKVKENKTPADTLKRGIGNGRDIDTLFAALANAAGFDARIALSPDRGDLFFDKRTAQRLLHRSAKYRRQRRRRLEVLQSGLQLHPLRHAAWPRGRRTGVDYGSQTTALGRDADVRAGEVASQAPLRN